MELLRLMINVDQLDVYSHKIPPSSWSYESVYNIRVQFNFGFNYLHLT